MIRKAHQMRAAARKSSELHEYRDDAVLQRHIVVNAHQHALVREIDLKTGPRKQELSSDCYASSAEPADRTLSIDSLVARLFGFSTAFSWAEAQTVSARDRLAHRSANLGLETGQPFGGLLNLLAGLGVLLNN